MDDQHPPPSSPSKVRPRGAGARVYSIVEHELSDEWGYTVLVEGHLLLSFFCLSCNNSSFCSCAMPFFFCTVCLNPVSLVHCCWLVHGKACCVYLTVNGLTWCIVSTFCTEVLTLPGNVIFSAACKPASDTQKKGLDNQTRCQFHCRETTLLTPCIIFLWMYFWLFFFYILVLFFEWISFVHVCSNY